MPDLATWGIAAAFAGGLISFFSPCTLPLVPGYLSVVTGGALTEASNRLKALWLSLCFVMGFSLIFIALGASASALGLYRSHTRGYIGAQLHPCQCRGRYVVSCCLFVRAGSSLPGNCPIH